jgi:FkbH-like protein
LEAKKVLDHYWLPECPNWKESLAAARQAAEPWPQLVELARKRLDFVKTNQLDQLLLDSFPEQHINYLPRKPIRLAVLGSCTVAHLLPGLRVAALRRGLHLQVYVTPYGQYQQELFDSSSALHRFHPDVVLLALDARHLLGQIGDGDGTGAVENAVSRLAGLWQRIRGTFGCQVVQQTLLPVFPSIMGSNEHRISTSRRWRASAFNHSLRQYADSAGVDLLALDASAEQHGVSAWYDEALWHKAKQEIHPLAVPMYGELTMRLVAAQRGLSSKCLVLDLDNTLWGGVIGDDGLEGIILGQGSALGEAYVEFQRWVLDQARRGVILAVCSKNDEENALLPFERHPEMVLSRSDIAAFAANWEDKPANLRAIANRLNIGTDSLVFVDDNAFERNIVRRELPEVAVPELPEDPALYASCLADGGYFEALSITADDLERTRQYQANLRRETVRAGATDLNSYLASLKMDLWAKPLDRVNLKRVTQLINKTNQFNLTTRRYSEAEVEALIGQTDVLGLHFRLTDSLGDNGIISAIIAKPDSDAKRMIIDTWLMSCRVLGRQVENACLNILAAKAKDLGATEIVGEYIPTGRNDMVRDHFRKLTFLPVREDLDGRSVWRLPLDRYVPFDTLIAVHEE